MQIGEWPVLFAQILGPNFFTVHVEAKDFTVAECEPDMLAISDGRWRGPGVFTSPRRFGRRCAGALFPADRAVLQADADGLQFLRAVFVRADENIVIPDDWRRRAAAIQRNCPFNIF